MGVMWAPPLEAGAAVLCWQLQDIGGPVAMLVAAGSLEEQTSSIVGSYWVMEEQTSSIIGGC